MVLNRTKHHTNCITVNVYCQNAINRMLWTRFLQVNQFIFTTRRLYIFLYICWKALLIVTVKERCEYPIVRSIFIICFWLLEKFLFTEAVQNQCLNMSSGGLFIHPFIYLFIHKHIYCWSPKLAVIYKSNGNRIIQN